MTLHERAIKYVAKLVKGQSNRVERIINLRRTFIPDVKSENGSMHEVEVLEHKFTKDFAREYLDAIKFGLPNHRSYMTLWFVIPNYSGIQKTFDKIWILVETKDGFKEVVEKGKQQKR